MGLLAETKIRRSINHDPNNTKWTRDTDRFGQKILRSQGWQPGEYLGAKDAPHSELHTSANASYIRVALKDDMKGLGFDKAKDDEATGLDIYSDLLSRLNGKSQAAVEEEKQARLIFKMHRYVEQKLGPMRFVRGGLLVGDELKESEDSAEEPKDEDKQADAASVPETKSKEKKSKKRKASSMEEESEGTKSEPESKDKKRRKEERKNKKRSAEKAVENLDNSTTSGEAKTKKKDKKEKRSKVNIPPADSNDEESESRPAKRKSKSKSDSTDSSAVDDADETKSSKKESKQERRERRKEKKERREEKKRRKASASTSGTSTPTLGTDATPAGSGTSTPRRNPHMVRSRFLRAKREAMMDEKALNQILMIKAS